MIIIITLKQHSLTFLDGKKVDSEHDLPLLITEGGNTVPKRFNNKMRHLHSGALNAENGGGSTLSAEHPTSC